MVTLTFIYFFLIVLSLIIQIKIKPIKNNLIRKIVLCINYLLIFDFLMRINVVSGGAHLYSSSETKRESKIRKVYVCDIRLPNNPFYLNDTIKMDLYEGWIEQSWRGGYLYWTTIPDDGYRIRLKGELHYNGENRILSLGVPENKIFLGYNLNKNMNSAGMIKYLPKNDTIFMHLYKNYYAKYPDSNIIGNLKIILERDNINKQ